MNTINNRNTIEQQLPDSKGYFGKFGGSFIPANLQKEMDKITKAYNELKISSKFISELKYIRKHFQGRPTPITYCRNLSKQIGGADIYLKREDLNHTGAHKLNHCMGEGLLAKYLGKKKMIAETGAGQHGVATATAAAYFGLECEIYMGEIDIEKQHSNVVRMQMLGAKVIPVSKGGRSLKEAVDASFEAYLKDPIDSIYCIGTVAGPHPFPMMVRDFQEIIGIEAKEQFAELSEGKLPDNIVACVGGGSNSIGIFSAFLEDREVSLYGVEPLGRSNKVGEHAATITYGTEGVLHGFKSLVLQDEEGNPLPVYSIASGLDYPSVGPEHAYLHQERRVNYVTITDKECLEAFYNLPKIEGIIPALESSHALAYAMKLAKKEEQGKSILVNLSGRGDKDIDFVVEQYGFSCSQNS